MGLFDSLFGGASSNAGTLAANAAKKGFKKGQDEFNKYTDTGTGLASPYYNQGADLYKGLTGQEQNAYGLRLDALGANGPQGNARATAAFQTSPGYQFQLDQGNQNILRNQASLGNLGSGASEQDLAQYGQGLANQDYQQWLTNLGAYNPANGIAGQAGELGNLANLYNTANQQKAATANQTQSNIGSANASGILQNAAIANQNSANGIGLLGSGLTGLTKLLGTGTSGTLLGGLLGGL